MSVYIDSMDSNAVADFALNTQIATLRYNNITSVPAAMNIAPVKTYLHDDDNIIFTYASITDKAVYTSNNYNRSINRSAIIGAKLTLNDGTRWAMIRFKNQPGNNSDFTQIKADDKENYDSDAWIVVANDYRNFQLDTVANSALGTNTTYENQYFNDDGAIKSFNVNPTGGNISANSSATITQIQSIAANTSFTNFSRYFALTSENTEQLKNLMVRVVNAVGHLAGASFASQYHYQNGLPSSARFTNGGGIISAPVVIPDFIPIYDAREDDDWIENVYDYLVNNNRHGDVDPFAPEEPTVITDYKSHFKLYMSVNKADKTKNDYQAYIVNNEYIANSSKFVGEYTGYMQKFGYDVLPKPITTQAQEMVVNWTDFNAWNSAQGNQQKIYMFYFGDNNLSVDEGQSSGAFKVWFKGLKNSEFGQQIEKVEFFAHWYDSSPTVYDVPRVAITDGFRYTNSATGEYIDIIFRGAGADDFKDAFDPDYPNKEDDEDDTTGGLPSAVVGNGLRTYKITDSGFKAVNEALWNTDWSTVFKSQTIDPIKSVISCKGIPFDISGAGSDTLYLANRSINIGSGAIVNPIAKFNIGTYTIQPIYANFVDMVYAKVRLYLPFIGWVELPANEVISRESKPNVGYIGKVWTLGFYYLVDFVDGTCRCVITRNGTEKWYFDGNCGIDIPVTSDNHTAAINNAIKSGVSTVMSVASLAGGAMSGNGAMAAAGVVGVAQNAPNVIPTYEFSATASSSGYINNAMNRHIMIIIEYPNAYYPSGYNHKYGLPCMLSKSLSACRGFTKTVNVDVSGINCTEAEAEMIASLLNTGVYF